METEGIAALLQRALAPEQPQALPLLSAALILCADHELNVSSFTARCVASAGSPPYAVVSAGLAALQGGKHGGMSARVEALFQEAGSPQQARGTHRAADSTRESACPASGIRSIRKEIRAADCCWNRSRAAYPQSPGVALAQAVMEAAQSARSGAAQHRFRAGNALRGAGTAAGNRHPLFALGRTIGWLGHAIEEYQADQLIRPRAHYTGVLPTQFVEKKRPSTCRTEGGRARETRATYRDESALWRENHTMLLTDIIERGARDYPERVALIFRDQPTSFGEMAVAVRRLAAGFRALGIEPGERIGLLLPNCPPFVYAYYAAAMIGAVVVPSNPLLKPAELAYIWRDCDLRAIVTVPQLAAGGSGGAAEPARSAPCRQRVWHARRCPIPRLADTIEGFVALRI